jgi:spore maturation protein A
MLNYIWLGLILAGIIAALSTDIFDLVTDKYRNDEPIEVVITFDGDAEPAPGKEVRGTMTVDMHYIHSFYGLGPAEEQTISFPLRVTFSTRDKAVVTIPVQEEFPEIWNEITRGQSTNDNALIGRATLIERTDVSSYRAELIPDPIRFVGMQRVTNEGIVSYASTAVTIALGLIGIMTLWLGVMKVAEEAGLVQAIARGLRPIMTRLFPDVPATHPAMGAMILNISANMLGLANAATPLGLKAMEELNK